MAQTQNYGTGKRKTSVARVFLRPGNGAATVNGRPLNEYFTTINQRSLVREPLQATETAESFDLYITVRGGGLAGQAGAVRHGIAKALVDFDPELRVEGARAPDSRCPQERTQEVRATRRSRAVPVQQALNAKEATAWPA